MLLCTDYQGDCNDRKQRGQCLHTVVGIDSKASIGVFTLESVLTPVDCFHKTLQPSWPYFQELFATTLFLSLRDSDWPPIT